MDSVKDIQRIARRRNMIILISFLVIIVIVYVFPSGISHFTKRSNQTDGVDTARISSLLAESHRLIDKPSELKTDLDSAISLAQQAERISEVSSYQRGTGNSNLAKAQAYRELNDHSNSRKYSEIAVSILMKYGNEVEKAKALIELGGSYDNSQTTLPLKIKLYEQGDSIFHKTGDKLSEARIMEFIADLYISDENFPKALELLSQTLSIYQSVGYKRLQGLYSLMASAYTETGNHLESLKYDLLAAKTGEQLNDTGTLMATIYNRLGNSYYDIELLTPALEYFRKALAISQENADTASSLLIQTNISDVLRSMGKYSEALSILNETNKYYLKQDQESQLHQDMLYLRTYIALKKRRQAELYYQKVLTWYHSLTDDPYYKQRISLLCAEYLQANGKFADTYPYLTVFETEIPRSAIGPYSLMNFERLYYRADSASGNLASALRHYQRYKKISDSSFNLEKSKQFDELRLQYETEKKDKDIQSLTQKNILQDNIISRTQLTKNIIIGGAVMLFLLLLISFKAYRQKQQSNLQLQVQQEQIRLQNKSLKKLLEEKEWLVREIHHRVKNNLQIVISLLNSQSAYLDNKDALQAIESSQHRMYAMSLIHQRLYQLSNLSSIDMQWYIREMVAYMRESFDSGHIRFAVNADKVLMDVVQAVPLGLILNEAITNAIKYAFPQGRTGHIFIDLKNQDALCKLSISDDGIGLPADIDTNTTDSLGMSLMRGLSEQIGGSLSVDNQQSEGVCLSVEFPLRNEMANANGIEKTDGSGINETGTGNNGDFLQE